MQTILTLNFTYLLLWWPNFFHKILGVLWIHTNAVAGSAAVINKFKEIGKKVIFVTNNSTKTRVEVTQKARDMEYNITEVWRWPLVFWTFLYNFVFIQDEVVTTSYLAAKYLKSNAFTGIAYIIGSTGISRELDMVNIRHTGVGPDVLKTNFQALANGNEFEPDPEVGAVIVGFDEHFSYPKMFKAATYLNRPGCLFIATNTDERFPMKNCVIPGTGSMVRPIEVAAGRPSMVMGKPSPMLCKALLDEHGVVPERTLMIGDRCNTDILFGSNCGYQTLLVGTGIHNLDDVQLWRDSDDAEDKKLIPDVFLPRLGDLLPFMDKWQVSAVVWRVIFFFLEKKNSKYIYGTMIVCIVFL